MGSHCCISVHFLSIGLKRQRMLSIVPRRYDCVQLALASWHSSSFCMCRWHHKDANAEIQTLLLTPSAVHVYVLKTQILIFFFLITYIYMLFINCFCFVLIFYLLYLARVVAPVFPQPGCHACWLFFVASFICSPIGLASPTRSRSPLPLPFPSQCLTVVLMIENKAHYVTPHLG